MKMTTTFRCVLEVVVLFTICALVIAWSLSKLPEPPAMRERGRDQGTLR